MANCLRPPRWPAASLAAALRVSALALIAGAAMASASEPPPEHHLAPTDTAPSVSELARERAAIAAFQKIDQRLQDAGWKLVRGNAPFCDKTTPAIGLQLHDVASYGRPDLVRAALGLSGDFAVQTAAAGSPAARTGGFRRNREVARIAALDPNRLPAGDRMHWQRLKRVHDSIDAALARSGPIAVTFASGSSHALEPVAVCAARFELIAGDARALADGERVIVGLEFPGFAYPEPVFAGALAHELAHVVLGHKAWLDRAGRKRRHIRLTEREADRLMPWLMANAGYDPWDAHRFMLRWGKSHDGGLFRKRTHDGWDERAEFIAGEIALIERLIEAEGRADWSVHFRREIEPGEAPEVARRD